MGKMQTYLYSLKTFSFHFSSFAVANNTIKNKKKIKFVGKTGISGDLVNITSSFALRR